MEDAHRPDAAAVAEVLLSVPFEHLFAWNWGCQPLDAGPVFALGDDWFINGVPAVVDRDLGFGYVVECVQRSTSALGYVVVYRSGWGGEPVAQWLALDAGTFAARRLPLAEVSAAGVRRIFELAD